ncbi:MAG: saccharopine dehydrogenase NADP-binding domain-containing protein [Bacteroidetes bacterium]|nr:saccharopine dehydrogenase NADP-binding domain-containing protein [Bacteroidota bacterium]MBU1578801.1 saccharopine dehydrogenase NADP-binding domain-containing protein [Bacteroidota bacterium]MBU2466388.1 saccharopine dehydrogenase NADP-binding domain-containing protein [Bacteroidota bacterium]MBU2558147.1 saccharopine dehydrogenase NADP-binding domain-containing protein [Bacteroidota bacterium]
MSNLNNVLVMGAGLVGLPIARDLVHNNEFDVTIADLDAERLLAAANFGLKTIKTDLLSNDDEAWFASFDIFVNAVPGSIGFKVLDKVIAYGKPIIDIAFYAEDPQLLQQKAKDSGSCVLCDMGVAPGMSHLLSGYAASKLKKVDRIAIYVGGLPIVRTKPWEYKAVFSPADVIEEYTRPARLIEHGEIVIKEALSDLEMLEFDGIGTLEAFNSDGLRSLLTNLEADEMVEKTLRYPGHAQMISLLKDSGFLNTETVSLKNQNIVPLEMTQKLLFDQWKLNPGEADITVMRVLVEGTHNDGRKLRHSFELFDQYDMQTQTHSMARTTGYAATAALRLIASGQFNTAGIHLPEQIGKQASHVAFIREKLAERAIYFEENIQEIG